MAEEFDFSELADYISVKEAAQLLGLSHKRVYRYIETNRLPARKIGRDYVLPKEAVRNFRLKTAGRPREKTPSWRIYQAGPLLNTEIQVAVRAGQQTALIERLKEMQTRNLHTITGTVSRYIIEGDEALSSITISLMWKDVDMPDEESRRQELEAFKRELDDVVDWERASERTSRVIIHT